MSFSKSLVAITVSLFALAGAGNALAQAFPSKPVHIIVPQTAGGASDALARIVGQKLSQRWGQPVIVENRPGAGGNVGTEYVARAPADGSVLVMSYVGTQAINGSVYKHLSYDPYKDFTPVATVATVPFALVVNEQFPPKNMNELIAYAEAHPGKVNFGSAGNGSLNQLLGEMINMQRPTKFVHVPYKGVAGALTDTMSGQVQMVFSSLPSVAGHIRGNKVRALAITGAKRSPTFPEIPTLTETGLTGFDISPWFGLLGPAGMPEAVVKKINADVNEIVHEKDVQAKFAAEGAEPYTTTPQEFSHVLQADIVKWAKVVKASGAHID